MNKVIDLSPAKEQVTISISGLTVEEIDEFPDKEFLRNF